MTTTLIVHTVEGEDEEHHDCTARIVPSPEGDLPDDIDPTELPNALHVVNYQGQTVAAYPPGGWISHMTAEDD